MLAPAPHYAVMWGSWGPEGTWTTGARLWVARFWDRLSFRMFLSNIWRRMPWRVLNTWKGWWTVFWDPRHLFAAYLNRDVHFTWSDFKQLKKLWGISRKRRNCLFPQARKHCRNGDADTYWDCDNKQNGPKRKTKKSRETKKGIERHRKQDKETRNDKEEGENDGFLK